MNRNVIFIAWIAHNRRSQLLADKFGMKLFLIQSLKRWYFLAPLRYLLQTARTLGILVRERPAVIFVQNPPIFAVMVVYLYAKLSGAKYVIDSHTGALLAPWWQWSLPIHAWLSRRAVTTIVTNDHLQTMVEGWGADAFIIADIPMAPTDIKPFPSDDRFRVVVINTFSPDEPVEAVLEAAEGLPEVQFYITGDPIRAKKTFLRNPPANVQFTGFLPDADYFGLLKSAQAIMVLTTDDHTMQRGACEAVSLARPIITSDWPLLRSYFNKGTLHVDNTSAGIQQGVRRAQEEQAQLEEGILQLQRDHRFEWAEKERLLTQIIQGNLQTESSSVVGR
jgi:glycosyltransferase involved in cell wall biosynthesis